MERTIVRSWQELPLGGRQKTESSMTDKASFPSDKMIRPEDIAEAALLPFRMSKFACPTEIVVRNAVRPT